MATAPPGAGLPFDFHTPTPLTPPHLSELDSDVLPLRRLGSLPSGLRSGHIMLIVLPLGVAVAAAAAVAVTRLRQGRPKMASVLGTALLLTLLAVGMVAWSVTYGNTRGVIEDKQIGILLHSGRVVARDIGTQLQSGVDFIKLLRDNIQSGGDFSFGAAWPVSELAQHRLWQTLRKETMWLTHTGTEAGSFHAVGPNPDGTQRQYIVAGPGEPLPPFAACPLADYGSAVGIDCPALASSGGCNASDGYDPDRLCLRSCRPDAPQLSYSHCYGSTAHLRRTEVAVSARRAIPSIPSSDIVFSEPPEALRGPSKSELYDPRSRPWYVKSTEPTWTEPYIFASKGIGTGISVSTGCYASNGTYLGAVAADYALSTMSSAFTPGVGLGLPGHFWLLFTAGAEPGGGDSILLGSALSGTNLTEDTGIEDIAGTLLRVSSIANPQSRIRTMVEAIAAGSPLRDAMSANTLLMHDGELVMAIPVAMESGLSLIFAISVLHSDVTHEADRASFIALGATVGISLAAAGLLFLFSVAVHRPLQRLSEAMGDVAAMRLDCHIHPTPRGCVAEVAHMQESFYRMVLLLQGYRDYLPQTVLLSGGDAGGSRRRHHHHPAPLNTATPSSSSSGTEGGGSLTCSQPPLPGSLSCESAAGGKAAAARGGRRGCGSGSGSVGGAAEAPAGGSLRVRRVTAAVVNIAGFNGWAALPGGSLEAMHARYLEPTLTLAKSCRGVVNSFVGDHVFISFNTLFATATHGLRGVRCCKALLSRYEAMAFPEAAQLSTANPPPASPLGITVNASASTGKALCGNIGCKGMKSYTIIGTPALLSPALERCGAKWGVPLVVDAALGDSKEVVASFATRALVVASWRGEAEQMLYAVEAGHGPEGWMYGGESFAQYNAAVAAMCGGRYAEALSCLRQHPDEVSPYHAALGSRIDALILRDTSPPAVIQLGYVPDL